MKLIQEIDDRDVLRSIIEDEDIRFHIRKAAMPEHVLFITFWASIRSGSIEIVRPEEITEVAWVDLNEADELMPYYKEGIASIVRSAPSVTYYDEGIVK